MSKRKLTSTNSIPKSLTSFLCGALRTDFSTLKEQISRKEVTRDDNKVECILEELFKFLYVHAGTGAIENNEIILSPSAIVDRAWHCLLLDNRLYGRVCDELLSLVGVNHVERPHPDRNLPHNPLNGDDVEARSVRYLHTVKLYKETFGKAAPAGFWPKTYDTLKVPPVSINEPLVETSVTQKILHFNVRFSSGEDIMFKVNPASMLVSKLKYHIAQLKGIPDNELRLFVDGAMMMNYHYISHYDLEDHEQIDCILETKGC